MRNTARLLAALLSLIAGPALAQNVPANSVQGRLGIPSAGGPVQSIPFSLLAVQLGIPPVANATFGAVRVWPISGAGPNLVGNMVGFNAYGTSLGCNALSVSACVQAAMDAAAPAVGTIFTLDTQRDLDVSIGYGGSATIDQRGYQNLNWRFSGLGFYTATLRSCEMCDIKFPTQVDSVTFNPNDAGAPGGDSLFQIVDSSYDFTTVFKVVFAKTSMTNSDIKIKELNVSSASITNGWDMPTPTSGNGNFTGVKTTILHAHSDPGSSLTTYFKIGDGAPSGVTFGYNSYDLHIDNTGRNGSQDGFVSYASNDLLVLRARGISTGNTVWWKSGSQANIAILQTDDTTPVIDSNTTASTNMYLLGGKGIYFGGNPYTPSLASVVANGIPYFITAPNGVGLVLTATSAMTDGQLLVGQTSAVPLLKTISGDATLAASGSLAVSSIAGVGVGTSGNSIPKTNTANTWSAAQTINLNATAAPSPVATGMQLVGANSTTTDIEIDTFANIPNFRLRRANGTNASPSALALDDNMGSIRWNGRGATGYGNAVATLTAFAAEAWTDTHQGTYVDLQSTPVTTVTLTTALRVTSDLGIIVPVGVTGGSKGAGTINSSGLYDSGNRVATLAGTNAWTGVNTFGLDKLLATAGNSASTVAPGGKLTAQLTSTGTPASTTETTLQTYSLPANALNANGRGVKITAWGSHAANANTKNVRMYFGASLSGTGAVALNGTKWVYEGWVFRTASNAQTYYMRASAGTTFLASDSGAAAETDSGAIVIKITGINGTATANDIVCDGMTVEMVN